jgi:hypothetical protein
MRGYRRRRNRKQTPFSSSDRLNADPAVHRVRTLRHNAEGCMKPIGQSQPVNRLEIYDNGYTGMRKPTPEVALTEPNALPDNSSLG